MKAILPFVLIIASVSLADPLPNTKPLTIEGDIASQLVAGVDRFLLRKLDESPQHREQHWKRDFASPGTYKKSIAPNVTRLSHILGVRDKRIEFDALKLVATTTQSSLVGRGDGYEVHAVRWPVLREMHGEGLLITPNKTKPVADIIAIPDADQTPEQIMGLAEGVAPQSQFVRRLAENGCRVIIPTIISRKLQRRRHATMTNREWSYRPAFELGRHLIGYEIQKVLSAVDWFEKTGDPKRPIGVMGYGEGGMIALYAAAINDDIDAVAVSGFFGPREGMWGEPIDRNVFGLLDQFGGAEIAAMVLPRKLIIEASNGPQVTLPPKMGGAPAILDSPTTADAKREFDRALALVEGLASLPDNAKFIESATCGHDNTLKALLGSSIKPQGTPPRNLRKGFDPDVRQENQVDEMERHSMWLLRESPYVRKEFMKKLNTSSLEKYAESVETYRDFYATDVIGRFQDKPLPFNARTRKRYDEKKWTGYDVVLDVFPDVIAYGVLLLPKNIKPGERRPVVVCQHGLEGRPKDTIEGNHRAYHDFAAKLAERGFITFAPQNLYIFKNRFRTLQRKANPLKKTLFSVIVPQHQQIVNWLKTLPQVDEKRIAFYGLSYGGKSAMRIPPLVTDYCLSICSADFNEWVDKNASTRNRYAYSTRGEYEIFEFDLGSTFNYAEMAALIAPRPFMVERGHFDGVAADETVAYEFAKVRHLYQAQLGIGDRCEIEWFVGPHTINGKGTFRFLHRHLNWPVPKNP